MTADAFSWLHLTDFHYGLKGQDCLWPTLRQPFLDDLVRLHKITGPWHAVLFTGDVTQSGTSAQFAEAQLEVFDRIWRTLADLGSGDAVLLTVPGNHDLYRPNQDSDAAVDMLLQKDGFSRISTKFWDNPSSPYRRVVTDAFSAYTDWWKGARQRPKAHLTTGILPGDFAFTLDVGSRRIGIVGLNTTFLQLEGGVYNERLVWDARQLHAVCGSVDDWTNQHDACLLLTHQGPEWLTPEARTHGDSEITPAGRFAAHFFGHMHETAIDYVRRGGLTDSVRLLQGCSLFGMETFGEQKKIERRHGYAAGRLEFGKKAAALRVWPRVANNTLGPWRFVPDFQNGRLEDDDQGTPPETIAVRAPAAPFAKAPSAAKANRSPRRSSAGTNVADLVAPHSTLPARRIFFGRNHDLETIAKVLQPEHVGWGVVLDGPGGVGKTTLAIEAAHRAPAEHYSLKIFVSAKQRRLEIDGVREIQDHRVDDYAALLSELGLALGRSDIPRSAPEQRPSLVRHALASHRALLVIDNLESFSAEERRRLYDLLETLPHTCRAIVTSRLRDDTAARTLRLDKLDPDAASQLLDSLTQHWPSKVPLSSHERQRLYSETGGNPLLLTWTAGQLSRTKGRSLTVDEALARLQEAHRLQGLNERNDPLDFVFGDLVETFTTDQTALLAALGYFTEPARMAWLLPLAKLSEIAARTALDDLRDRALLIEDHLEGTWTLPPLAARFLRRRRPEAVSVAGDRLATQAVALALQHGEEKNAPFAELEAVWPNVQPALPLIVAGDVVNLVAVCNALFDFLVFTGRWDQLLSLNQAAEERAVAARDYHSAAWRAYHAGWAHYLRGISEAVFVTAERCEQYRQKFSPGAYDLAELWTLRGAAHELNEDHPRAIEAHSEALKLLRAANETGGVGIALSWLGEARRRNGDLDEAETAFNQALNIARTRGDRVSIAGLTGQLSGVLLDRGEWATAERQASLALELAKGIGRIEYVALDHHRLAVAKLHQGRVAEALTDAQRAVSILTQLHHFRLAEAQSILTECEVASR